MYSTQHAAYVEIPRKVCIQPIMLNTAKTACCNGYYIHSTLKEALNRACSGLQHVETNRACSRLQHVETTSYAGQTAGSNAFITC